MKFTIVVPLAPERNAEIISSIKELDYPKKNFHVVVVKGKNPSENRNKGSEKALGEFIVFLDDDAFIEKDYLKKVDEFFKKNPQIDVVGGPQLTPKDQKGFAKISGYALSSKFGAWKISDRYSCKEEKLDVDECSLTSANLIVRKKVMEKIKFDSSLFPGEDPKFIFDCKKENFKIAYSPEIVVYHKRRKNLLELAKQIFNYGKVRPLKEKFSETLKMPFFLVPALFVIYLIFLIGLLISNLTFKNFRLFEILFFLPLVIYLFLLLIFSFYDSLKNKDIKAVFVLPIVYPTIHLSYGVGIIYGYFKKICFKIYKFLNKTSLNNKK